MVDNSLPNYLSYLTLNAVYCKALYKTELHVTNKTVNTVLIPRLAMYLGILQIIAILDFGPAFVKTPAIS